jgi:hypothetical protein
LVIRFPILFEIRRPNNDHPRLLWRVFSFGQVEDSQPKHAHRCNQHENRQVEVPPIFSVIVQIPLSALTNNYQLSRSAVSSRRVRWNATPVTAFCESLIDDLATTGVSTEPLRSQRHLISASFNLRGPNEEACLCSRSYSDSRDCRSDRCQRTLASSPSSLASSLVTSHSPRPRRGFFTAPVGRCGAKCVPGDYVPKERV